MDATEEISNMLGVMEYEFKEIIDKNYNSNLTGKKYHDYGQLSIYMDTYRKIELY